MDEGGVGGSDGAGDDRGGHDDSDEVVAGVNHGGDDDSDGVGAGDNKDDDNLVGSVRLLLDSVSGSSGPTSPSISSAADAQMLNPSQGHSDNNVPLF